MKEVGLNSALVIMGENQGNVSVRKPDVYERNHRHRESLGPGKCEESILSVGLI